MPRLIQRSREYHPKRKVALGRHGCLVLLIDMEILVDTLHLDLAVVGNDTHQSGANVPDVIVLAQEFDMVVDGLIGIWTSGRKALVEVGLK